MKDTHKVEVVFSYLLQKEMAQGNRKRYRKVRYLMCMPTRKRTNNGKSGNFSLVIITFAVSQYWAQESIASIFNLFRAHID
jgi:hypothetical protein